MREYRQTMQMPADHVLHVRVPEVPKGEQVEVIVVSGKTDRAEKLASLALAAKDPLYARDIQEIEADFSYSDSEDK